MKPITKILLALLSVITLSSTALAMDEITLNNGQKVQGTVLNDVPNMYVDIELPNGNKQRYKHEDVRSVDRDVPSNTKESAHYGNESVAFFGVMGGFSIYSESDNTTALGTTSASTTQFDYGARAGFNVTQMGDFGKLALAVHFDRFSVNSQVNPDYSTAYNFILGQVLVRKVGNTGLYFGPEAGLAIVSQSTTLPLVATTSANAFAIGGVVGYEQFLGDSFSVGPEVHFDHVAGPTFTDPNTTLSYTTSAINTFKFLLNLSVHL